MKENIFSTRVLIAKLQNILDKGYKALTEDELVSVLGGEKCPNCERLFLSMKDFRDCEGANDKNRGMEKSDGKRRDERTIFEVS